MAAGDGGLVVAGSEELIEGTAVPDHVLMAEQMELNQAIAAGELSGPALAVNGRPSAALEEKRQELAQRAALAALTVVVPLPKRAPDPEEKPADKARMREALAIFKALPQPGPGEVDHLASPRAQLEALRDFLDRKWAPQAPPPPPPAGEQLQAILGPPPKAQAFRLRDGRFDRDAVVQALDRLQQAEAWAEGHGGLAAVQGLLDAYRSAVLAAMGATRAVAPAPAAPDAAPAAPKPKAPPPPPRPRTAPLALPPEPEAPQGPDPAVVAAEWAARRQALHALPLAARQAQLQALQEGGAQPGDVEAGLLASSIAIDAPEGLLDEAFVPWVDAHGFQQLVAKAPFALFLTPPPKVRLALVKSLVAVEAEANGPAAAELAGKLAAELIRQHPRALGELVGPLPGAWRGKMIAVALEGLEDEAIAKYSREALAALGRALGPPTTDEVRRQSSRLLRLGDGK